MLNYKAIRTDRQMKALTGLKIKEFEALSKSFGEILRRKVKQPRHRAEGAGRKHTLKEEREKLFFTLLYVKCYPTFDVLGFFYGVDRAQTNRWIHEYLPILEQVLGYEVVLPERKIDSPEQFYALYPEIKQVFIDGVERPSRRPNDCQQQNADYSGKKRRHTKKTSL